jgi:GT2 family glycosyltransferase
VSSATRPTADTVTVIVPTTGGAVVGGCLDSIGAGSTWPARLIVVDQGRKTEVADAVSALRARGMHAVYVPSTATGISAATNLGLEHVETPYAAITHDDCRVRQDWLERLTARMAEVGEAVLTGRVEPEGDGIVLTIKTQPEPATYTAPLLRGDVLFPPNMAFPVCVLTRAGWFDEHPSLATAGEDNEWAHRLLTSGVPIVYDPTVVVGHLARHRPSELSALYLRYARGQGAFYGKWLRRGDPFIARRAARDLVRAPWLLIRGVVTGNSELVAMGAGEVRGLLPGIIAGLRNRPETGERFSAGSKPVDGSNHAGCSGPGSGAYGS